MHRRLMLIMGYFFGSEIVGNRDLLSTASWL
jgi:hypothetical protein